MRNITMDWVHPSWRPFFTAEILHLLEDIDQGMTGVCNPEPSAVLRFAQQPLEEVQVLILGQDTYPALGVATGRAFEVGGLTSWHSPCPQNSLRSIIRRLYADHSGKNPYDSDMKTVREAITWGEFPVLDPDLLFDSWAEQGVLLLNTALSCQAGKAGSHVSIWKPFAQQLLAFIAIHCPHIHVFLWGSFAQGFASVFSTQTIHMCRHPMLCSVKYEDDFLKFTGFQETSHLIRWMG